MASNESAPSGESSRESVDTSTPSLTTSSTHNTPPRSDRILRSKSRTYLPSKSEQMEDEKEEDKSDVMSGDNISPRKRKRAGATEESKPTDKTSKSKRTKNKEETPLNPFERLPVADTEEPELSSVIVEPELHDDAIPISSAQEIMLPMEGPVNTSGDMDKEKADAAANLRTNPELFERLMYLQDSLQAFISTFPVAKLSGTTNNSWGELLSQNQHHGNVSLSGNLFSVGRHAKCNLVIEDVALPFVLFKLHYNNAVVELEYTGPPGMVHLNHKSLRKGSKLFVKHGDEIHIHTPTKIYSFSYHQHGKPPVEQPTMCSPIASSQTSRTNTSALLRTTGKTPADLLTVPYMTRSRRKKTPSVLSPKPAASSSPLPTNSPLSSPVEDIFMSDFDSPITYAMPTLTNGDATPPLSAKEIRLKHFFKVEFMKQMIDPKDIDISFDSFPYYLSDNVKQLLINGAFIYLARPEFTKFIANLSPQSRKMLLCGPHGTELYQEALVKALCKHFNASLFILDSSHLDCESNEDKEDEESMDGRPKSLVGGTTIPKFKKGDKVKYIGSHATISRYFRHSGITSTPNKPQEYRGKVMITFEENPRKVGLKFDKPLSESSINGYYDDGHSFIVDAADLKYDNDDKYDALILESLFEVISDHKRPCVVFVREVEATLFSSCDRFNAFKSELSNITTPFVVIGSSVSSDTKKEKPHNSKGHHHHTFIDLALFDHYSRVEERTKDPSKALKLVHKVFTNRITILPPTETDRLAEWNKKLVSDTEQLKLSKNKRTIQKILQKNNLECEELKHVELTKQIFPSENLEKVVGWAVSHQSMFDATLPINGKYKISNNSMEYAINLLLTTDPDTNAQKNLKDIDCENEFERKLLAEVIPPNEIDIKFEDIGALDEVKQTLRELVMLPLQRPELFSKGALTKPCKGILLFGPPGTGKTMLAKAVATQSGANFINVSMATIASKWFGEGEKYVKALFTLASKISPTVIFIDEVDSILGKRERTGEHEAMRKIKNEFMSNWDGLKTKDKERVLVLAATNRPFDLDDAVLRRLSRRLMVDLPSPENRVKILKVILAKEDLEPNFDFEMLAKLTEGYSGSDLKNLSVSAAYQPIREILAREKEEERLGKKAEQKEIFIRSLTMKDFEKAATEISPSVSEDAYSVAELRKWNELFGEGGTRKKDTLTYFM